MLIPIRVHFRYLLCFCSFSFRTIFLTVFSLLPYVFSWHLYLDRRLEHKNPASVLLPFEESLLRPFAFVSPSNAVVFLHWTEVF